MNASHDKKINRNLIMNGGEELLVSWNQWRSENDCVPMQLRFSPLAPHGLFDSWIRPPLRGIMGANHLGSDKGCQFFVRIFWADPAANGVCRRQRSLDVQVMHEPSSGGPHLLVDCTGIKLLGELRTEM
jgi:hypothetical protein